ncbi:Isoprenylcysteine carboxyl methyltransferase (ICMT) family protein [Botrimarina hoheduenensis]|uniref:Isoprenylcysteine carboxyl methyltransferase (ICMT) family protein n=2 Tax=Botrimarina hoheduenensis TaxID=2528000 RepID=A0A5C5WBZ6_9BACT|nr:Isoprenylcysteine carboxyl methyltransferase (ICMT) family protein [Botrimarina hoheduenensis]
MGMRSEFVRQGNWLFRYRSYVPIVFLVPLIMAVMSMRWPFGSYQIHEYWEFSCLAVSFLGVGVRVFTVGHTPAGTSGRNTHAQVAESLNTSGIYSMVRHPLYLGNYLMGLGAVLVPMEAWLPALYTLAFWLYYERIMFAEEDFLRNKFGEKFSAWVAATPGFIPNPLLWRRPELPFSLRNVLKREYTGLALVVVLHTGIEALEHFVIERNVPIETFWVTLLATTGVAYFVLRSLRRHSKVLQVEGR